MMDIRFQTQQLSGLSLFITVIGSLPFYLLVSLMVFLDTTIFITLLGSLALSSLLDRVVSHFLERRSQTQVEVMQQRILKIMSSFLPFLDQTLINPVIRRITMLLATLTFFSFSPTTLGIAILILLSAVYAEYVELKKPLTTIVWGLLVGGVSSSTFIALQFL